MTDLLGLMAAGLMGAFVVCCVASALLQVLAWTRHKRPGMQVSLGALWKPDGRFDEVGLRQMLLARRLLVVAGVAYLSYGVLLLVTQSLAGGAG